MKKALIASLLGLTVSIGAVHPSFGQGQVWFANYLNGTFITDPIAYANSQVPPGKEGLALGGGFNAQLLYGLGASPLVFTEVPDSIRSFFPAADGDLGSGAGYFSPAIVTIPGYSSGPVTFIVRAFDGATYDTSFLVGESLPFTLSSIAVGNEPVGDFTGSSFSAFTVVIVPEPSSFALAGLGAAALMIFRRRK